jgi:DNA repair photolyase
MHVVSASRRTDIPAFYTEWLFHRIREGYCLVPNPFSARAYRVSLRTEDVLAWVFWSRNPAPLLPCLDELDRLGHRYYFQLTINAYGRRFEPSTPPPHVALQTARRLCARLGPERVIWRYDPILETSVTPWSWHIREFSRMASALAGQVRICVFSFVNLYRRARLRLDRQAVSEGFNYRFLPIDDAESARARQGVPYSLPEMKERSEQLGEIAALHGIQIQSCCMPGIVDPARHVGRASCVDPGLIERLCGRPLALKVVSTRDGCACAESKDIGAYETCAHGCGATYCYAVRNHDRALANRRRHDPHGETLVG